MKKGIGERMKFNYEQAWNIRLPYRLPTIIRLDGKNFHGLTRRMDRPFDELFMDIMQQLTLYICSEIQTAVFGYSQSDEISLLLIPYKKHDTEPFFNNEIQKMASISAGMASAYFSNELDKIVVFDSRVFVLPPEDEVCNYFIWRQQDASRNSVSMVAQSKFSHKQLQGKSSEEMQEMLYREHGINWNDLSTVKKRGFAVYREVFHWQENNFTHDKKTGLKIKIKQGEEIMTGRSGWKLDLDIPIFTQDRNFIEKWLDPNAQPVELEYDVEIDERGHDLQCSSGIGKKCDCWRDPTIRAKSKQALKISNVKGNANKRTNKRKK